MRIPESAEGTGVAEDLLPPKRSLRTLAIVVGGSQTSAVCEVVEAVEARRDEDGENPTGQRGAQYCGACLLAR